MKRDMDLVRNILLEMEKSEHLIGWMDLEIGGVSESELNYHVRLLDEAGLIEAQDLTTSDGVDWRPVRLTWRGHEFLESAREDTRWQKAKSIMMEKAGGLSFQVLGELLLKLMRGSVMDG